MAAPIPDAMSLSQAERNREAQGPKPFLQALNVYPKRDALPGASADIYQSWLTWPPMMQGSLRCQVVCLEEGRGEEVCE